MTGTGLRHCPALLISAPASGQGKTTLTAALARYHRNQGRRVRVFKAGPDFLDPMILEQASGGRVYQLDLWMGGEDHCRRLLYEAASEADLILIEGVMGLFDSSPSTADLAMCFGVPVLAVIDAAAMAGSFGAVALGLCTYRPELPMAGVVANRVAGEGHAAMLGRSVLPVTPFLGALKRDDAVALPHRHLGLLQAGEIADLEVRLERVAAAVAGTKMAQLPPPVAFAAAPAAPLQSRLAGVRIAVAYDAAFSFLYTANLDVLRSLGATLVYFSPLDDSALPEADSLYLPGGYPELHLERLAANRAMCNAIRAHHFQGKPVVAECGGMLYLLESLTDVHGERAALVGLLPGHGVMQERLANLGMQSVNLPEGMLRGHTFHHSRMTTSVAPLLMTADHHGGRGEPVYRIGRLHAAYFHAYFPSDPQAVAGLFLP